MKGQTPGRIEDWSFPTMMRAAREVRKRRALGLPDFEIRRSLLADLGMQMRLQARGESPDHWFDQESVWAAIVLGIERAMGRPLPSFRGVCDRSDL